MARYVGQDFNLRRCWQQPCQKKHEVPGGMAVFSEAHGLGLSY